MSCGSGSLLPHPRFIALDIKGRGRWLVDGNDKAYYISMTISYEAAASAQCTWRLMIGTLLDLEAERWRDDGHEEFHVIGEIVEQETSIGYVLTLTLAKDYEFVPYERANGSLT